MKIDRFKNSDHDIYMETFNDVGEFVRLTDKRPENSWSNNTTITGNDREWLLHGWSEKRDEIKAELSKLEGIRTKEKKSKVKVYSVNGYYPNVSKAIIGNPKCMRKFKKVTSKSKIVEIIWDPGILARESADRITTQGIKLLSKIKELELSGYRVRLMVQGFKGEYCGNRNLYICRIPIKEENQQLDISRVSYPLANAGMLRKWVFKWYEHLPNAEYLSGYGKSLYAWDFYERDKVLNTININHNQYYVNIDTDIEEMFKEF